MSFSVGILYSAQDFLRLVESTPDIDQRFPGMFKSFGVASAEAVLEVSERCEWIRFNVKGFLEVTMRGQEIIESADPECALRRRLRDLIAAYDPPWAPLLARGRLEAIRFLSLNVQQCLREAGLLGEVDDEVISWWDDAGQVSRRRKQDERLEIGRVGERLSLEYEKDRTAQKPVWQAVESNLTGYDILSVVSDLDASLLRIEVKTTDSSPRAGSFHITRNEWVVAQESEHYTFHLWALKPKPQLFVVNV